MDTIKIQELGWDTNQFEIKVGKVELLDSDYDFEEIDSYVKEILKTGKENGFNLLYLILPENKYLSNGIGQVKNILLADRKIIYNKTIDDFCTFNIQEIHNYGYDDVNEQLLNLALISGKYSRFKLDQNFSVEIFEKMYWIWIEKSVKKEIADDVLVFEENNRILGMLTYKIDKISASIGLLSVDNLYQGKKIGTKLLNKLEYILKSRGIKEINVATQHENKDACKFYEKNNYRINNITNIYHIWL